MPLRTALAVLVLLAGAAGCSRSANSDLPVQSPVQVRVTNNHALPVEIFAEGSGIRHRLGTVHPGMEGEFRLPPNLVGGGSIEFEIKPATNVAPFRSAQLLVNPGSLVDLVVGARLFNSTVEVR